MKPETFWRFPTGDLIMFVESVRYLIAKAGGMATKSLIEDVIMDRFGIDRFDAHTLTNMAEQANSRFFAFNPMRWTADRWPEPHIEDWPYLVNFKPTVVVYAVPIVEGRFFRLWRQFERIQLTYRAGWLAHHIAEEIANSYWFLVPPNTAVTAGQLSEAMYAYSSHPRVTTLASILAILETNKKRGY